MALWTLLAGALCFGLAVGVWPTTIPHLQCLVLFALVAIWDERRLLAVVAWLAPFFLANVALRSGVYILDAALAMMLFADALRRLLGRRGPEETFPKPFPRLVFVAAAVFAGATLGAAVEAGRLFREGYAFLGPMEAFSALGRFVIPAYTGMAPGGEGLRMAMSLVLSLGTMEYCFRRLDSDASKSLVLCFGLALCATAFLGLAEFVGLADLVTYRRLGMDYVDGQRRLMAFALHPGWFAQHLAMAWPFLLVAYEELHHRGRKSLLVVGAGLVLAAILTRQRALWLIGLIVAGGWALRTLWLGRRGAGSWLSENRGFALKVALAGVVFLALVDVWFGGLLRSRLGTLLRYQDRLYYYYSTFGLLREAPWGVGLGLHGSFYDALFIPKADFWQADHATAHSSWLHVLAERGPLAALGLLGLMASLFWSGWRRARFLDNHGRAVAKALWLGLAGIGLYSLVQYIFYVRVIEIMFFIYAGALLGLRPPLPPEAEPVPPARRPRLGRGAKIAGVLLGAGAMVATAWGQYVWAKPLRRSLIEGNWAGKRAVFLVPRIAESLDMTLFVHGSDRDKTISAFVDGEPVVEFAVPSGGAVGASIPLEPSPALPWDAYRRVELEASSVVEEQKLNPDAPGHRKLGVWIGNLAAPREPASNK